MGRLQDKVAIITGAAGGQGQVAVAIFAREGAKVVASDLVEKGALAPTETEYPESVTYVQADVTREEDLERIVKAAVDRFGRIDVLYNNHGAMVGSPFLETSMEEFDRCIAVNLRASFRLSQLAAREMVKVGGGSIIHNSSTGGLVGFPDMAAYGASKGGVAQLARSMANDLVSYGIRVNAICPGAIDTPMPHKYLEKVEDKQAAWDGIAAAHPMKRFGRPEEVVNLALFLASDEASYMTGAVIPVDGGFTAV